MRGRRESDPLREYLDDRHMTCLHEAGHAVMAVLLGIEVTGVLSGAGGQVNLFPVGPRKMLALFMAGIAVEMRESLYARTDFSNLSDRLRAADCVQRIRGSRPSIEELEAFARGLTELLGLGIGWKAVEAVVQALETQSGWSAELDGDEVERIIRGVCAWQDFENLQREARRTVKRLCREIEESQENEE
jgi:hypothetical protein